jgi:hypothetical protein
MISYKIWTETKQRKFEDFKNVILPALNLDSEKGISTTIDSLSIDNLKSKLQSLEIFKLLPTKKQQEIMKKIEGEKSGTILDLINNMIN